MLGLMDDPELVQFATKLFGLARSGQADTARMFGHEDFLAWFGAA
jgi:hypothetical protein